MHVCVYVFNLDSTSDYEVERDLHVLGVRRWRRIETKGGLLFDRPKPTMGCSAIGRKRSTSDY
jgi:hypothetical protein